jgi:ABC-2 type transport system ATP-binding protein
MDNVIEVHGLHKSYRSTPVLRDVAFDVRAGEIFGLLGVNGAGKTTAVEVAQGIRRADAGVVRVLGRDPWRDRASLRSVVGSQLQSSALPERLRVGEALRLFSRLAGDVVEWRSVRDRWDLAALEHRSFGGLSGGERQRVFLALALVNRPRLVFLDELTQGLDAAARRHTGDLIEGLRRDGVTVVLVTHHMDEAQRLCDRIAVLDRGRVLFTGRPSELIDRRGGPVQLTFTLADPAAVDGLARVPGVVDVRLLGTLAEVRCASGSCVPVIGELDARGVRPSDLCLLRPTLEEAFIALTSDRLADPRAAQGAAA